MNEEPSGDRLSNQMSRRDVLRSLGAVAATSLVAADGTRASASTRSVTGPVASPTRYANQNAYGPSAKAIAAVRDASADVVFGYSQAAVERLRSKIAERYEVSTDRVVLGCGSSEILLLAADVFLGPGKRLVTAHPTCAVMPAAATAASRHVTSVPLALDHSHDLTAMLAACDARTGLVYICNPNNPTGTVTRRAGIDAFLARRPADTMVLIDEAYQEYVAPSEDALSYLQRPAADDRVIVVRTFSKIHGLAGLRVGYAIASPRVAAVMASKRLPLGVSGLAAEAAIAALDDPEHVRVSERRNADDRQEFFNHANARMLRVIDSQTNFAMLDTARPAGEVVAHFRAHGLTLPSPWVGYERHVRVSIGTAAEMTEFWRVWDLMPVIHSHG